MSEESKVENIPNTFMPDCVRSIVSVDYILQAMRWGFVHFDKLPEDIRAKVLKELEHRRQNKSPINSNLENLAFARLMF